MYFTEVRLSNSYRLWKPKGRTYVYSTLHSDKNHSCPSYRKYTIQCPYYHCFYYVLYTYETNSAKEKLWHYGELQRPCRHNDYKAYSCLLRMNITMDEPERKVLMYWNENIGCGVYIVLVNETKAGCELHSRDGTHEKAKITGDLQTCHSEFRKHCQEYTRGNDYMTRCNMQAGL
ncbi:hypothetical protein MRX96_025595 [Rhipicephalus microplus]